MPVMNGYDATREIRHLIDNTNKSTERKVKVPSIVALTASVSASQKGQIIGQGFNECLLKPLEKKDLVVCLQRFSK
jgi:CheY-like chemotaxis protein